MTVWAVVAPSEAERSRRALDHAGQLDVTRRAQKVDNGVALPLLPGAEREIEQSRLAIGLIEFDGDGDEPRARGVHAQMRGAAHAALEATGASASHACAVADALPRRWEKLGDVALLAPHGILGDGGEAAAVLAGLEPAARDALWGALARALSVSRVGVQGRIEPSRQRKSGARLLWPDGAAGWTTVRERGITYGLDVTRTMFSSGNGTEKARVARFNCAQEIVVDLYAGIGYFTLPYLVHARAEHVHACELDSDALSALRHNLHANGVDARCTVHAGDNADSAPAFAGCAHRVNLGLIPSSELAWPVAVRALRPAGGTLHVHMVVGDGAEGAFVAKLQAELSAIAAAAGRAELEARVVHVERVKWYAPKLRHVVADVTMVALDGH